ncbi:MAG TPA: response regulator [Planctomycetaceae bacterium]|jgi:DNA-binding response OmpR family regulator|nr:response regulator [Planctomycetaceae bacterium]
MSEPVKVLIIDDDREISSTLRTVLESAGFVVSVANNGKEGQKQIVDFQPRLVITDMMMPQMGGFPVLEFIRQLPNPPRVIMITANEGGRHKAYAEMLGAVDYLRKPFAMDQFLDAVLRALGMPTGAAAIPETDVSKSKKPRSSK